MKNIKVIIGLIIALAAIAAVAVIALRYLDVILKSVETVRSALKEKVKTFRPFYAEDEDEGECELNCEDCVS